MYIFTNYIFRRRTTLDSSDVTQFIILLILLALSAYFSSAETALTTVNKIRIRTFAEEGNKRADTLLKVIDDSGKMLSAILIGNNIVNLSASALATSLTMKLWGNVAVSISTGILTLLILVFGEIAPKTLSTIYSEKVSLSYAGSIYFLMRILTPVIFIVNKLSLSFLKLFKIDQEQKVNFMTENELRNIVEVSHEDGVIQREEREIIYNLFDFSDTQAKEVMVPRIDMTFVNIENTYSEILEIFKEDKYTRYPVYESSTDNVVGIINIKDLLLYENIEHFNMRHILREPYYTYEHKNTAELLLEMRNASYNIAIVLDEYGATAGLITLEDLLEEIVGEIRDEYDGDEEDLIQKISDLEYRISGSLKIDDLNERLNLNLDSKDYDSIGGYIIELLDHLPEEGEETITEDNILLHVETMDKNRIDTIYMKLPSVSQEMTVAEEA